MSQQCFIEQVERGFNVRVDAVRNGRHFRRLRGKSGREARRFCRHPEVGEVWNKFRSTATSQFKETPDKLLLRC